MLVDVTPLGVTGRDAERLLDEIGITVNKNAIPFDQNPPNIASGHPDRDARDHDPRHSGPTRCGDRPDDRRRRSARGTSRPSSHALPPRSRELRPGFPVPGLATGVTGRRPGR